MKLSLSTPCWCTTSLRYVVVASYVPTVVLFWGTPRYTLLIIPELLLFTSFAMLAVYDRIAASDRRRGRDA